MTNSILLGLYLDIFLVETIYVMEKKRGLLKKKMKKNARYICRHTHTPSIPCFYVASINQTYFFIFNFQCLFFLIKSCGLSNIILMMSNKITIQNLQTKRGCKQRLVRRNSSCGILPQKIKVGFCYPVFNQQPYNCCTGI